VFLFVIITVCLCYPMCAGNTQPSISFGVTRTHPHPTTCDWIDLITYTTARLEWNISHAPPPPTNTPIILSCTLATFIPPNM